MTTIEKPAAADPYLAAVGFALVGVPDGERQELLDDLADHLAELAADEEGNLAERLGEPEAYAAEFVASAGIEVPTIPAEAVPPPPLWRRARVAVSRFVEGPTVGSIRAFLPELRAGWWVLRAWAALAVLAAFDDNAVFPFPDVADNRFVSLLVLGGAIAASVHLARGGGWPDRTATVLGVLGVLVALGNGGDDVQYVYDDYGQTFGTLTGPNGEYIQNIWPYDGEGNPLDGVLLFDQDGNPISVGEQPTSAMVIPGLFPQPQYTVEYDPATGIERQAPRTPPVVHVPPLLEATTTTTSALTTTTAPAEETIPLVETTDTTLPS